MNESLLRLLETTRRIGTWWVDVAASRCHWSQITYEIHEEDPDKAIELERGIDYYVPEHRPIIQRCVEQAIEEHKSWNVELRIRTARGNVRWVHAVGEPVFEGSTLVRLQGIFEDIDERKRLEVEREQTLRRMLEGERIAKLGHWWWDVAEGVVQWTPGVYRMFELPEDRPALTIEEHLPLIHPDDRARFQGILENAIADGEAYEVDFRLVLEGRVKHIYGEGFPQHGANGELQGFIGVALDRTASERGRRRIESLNRRLNLALNASHIGVWEWNLATDELIWDDRMFAIYGVSRDAFTGAYSAWESGLHPDDREAAAAAVRQAVETCGRFETTFRVVWPDGTVRTLQGMGDVVPDAQGRAHQMIGVNWDITRTVEIQRELERSNEELSQFAYRTSHDLKAPMTAIRRLASYLLEDLGDNDLAQVRDGAERIEHLGLETETMVLGILDAARADLAEIEVEPVDLNALVEAVVARHREMARSGSSSDSVELTWEVRGELRPSLPRARIEQVLGNLVANGIQYADWERERPYVAVRVDHDEGCLRLSVEDNGLGIPGTDPEAPFQMFKRFRSDVSGSGLGLYIVKKQVDALGGSIRFESSRKGTTFHVRIPTHVATCSPYLS